MPHMQPEDASTSRPVRILVVDDDEGIRALLEVAMSLDPRFELVASAGSAGQALEVLQSGVDRVDVVLLDVTLPDRDGIEFVGELRAAVSGARVVLFTGWSDADTLRRARDAGADAVFGKDGDPQGLLDGIASLDAQPS